jgi:hypothetical protein
MGKEWLLRIDLTTGTWTSDVTKLLNIWSDAQSNIPIYTINCLQNNKHTLVHVEERPCHGSRPDEP